MATQIDLTVRGHGISSTPSLCAEAFLGEGKLVRVLPGWSVPLEEIYIYYPTKRSQSAALRAFIRHLIRQR